MYLIIDVKQFFFNNIMELQHMALGTHYNVLLTNNGQTGDWRLYIFNKQ